MQDQFEFIERKRPRRCLGAKKALQLLWNPALSPNPATINLAEDEQVWFTFPYRTGEGV